MIDYEFSPLAEQDLYDIWATIALDNRTAADKVLRKIREAVRRLAEHPGIGHRREDFGNEAPRVWTVYSYLIVYRPDTNPLQVVRIVHGAQEMPAAMNPLPR